LALLAHFTASTTSLAVKRAFATAICICKEREGDREGRTRGRERERHREEGE
jgi:hypothetical protein